MLFGIGVGLARALRRRFDAKELTKIKNLKNDYLVHARME
jgi:hypothetical protein